VVIFLLAKDDKPPSHPTLNVDNRDGGQVDPEGEDVRAVPRRDETDPSGEEPDLPF